MARTRSTLAVALAVYLALLPLAGWPAGAQPPGAAAQPLDAPDPGAAAPIEPRPIPPSPPRENRRRAFAPAAAPLTVRGFNGFTSVATPGVYHHRDHGHSGGLATFASPWGEQLELRYWLSPHGVTFEYDRDLKVRYRFDEAGTLEEIVAETPERTARMAVGDRAELAYLGQSDPESFDLSAYLLIDEELRARHSQAFLDGLAGFEGAVDASCTTQGIQCIACVVLWAASVGAIASACTVGGVVTFGTACLLAILAHEASSFSCAATCLAWGQDCWGGRQDDANPIPDGCDPP